MRCYRSALLLYPLIGLYPLERVFAHILTGHAMRALRSTRIMERLCPPSIHARARRELSIGAWNTFWVHRMPLYRTSQVDCSRLSLQQRLSWPAKKWICSYVTNMGKRRPTKRAGAQAAAQGPKRARPGSLSPVADGFTPAATGRSRGSGITLEKTLVARHQASWLSVAVAWWL